MSPHVEMMNTLILPITFINKFTWRFFLINFNNNIKIKINYYFKLNIKINLRENLILF
jgi:hypothetical protein